jgi:hypothetical protein
MYVVWLETGFGLIIGFIGLFDSARDYTLQFTISHTLVSTVTSSPSSGFPNCPRPQLPATLDWHSSQLLFTSLTQLLVTVLLIAPRHGQYRKHGLSAAVYRTLPSNGCCLVVFSRSLPSNGSECYNIYCILVNAYYFAFWSLNYYLILLL